MGSIHRPHTFCIILLVDHVQNGSIQVSICFVHSIFPSHFRLLLYLSLFLCLHRSHCILRHEPVPGTKSHYNARRLNLCGNRRGRAFFLASNAGSVVYWCWFFSIPRLWYSLSIIYLLTSLICLLTDFIDYSPTYLLSQSAPAFRRTAYHRPRSKKRYYRRTGFSNGLADLIWSDLTASRGSYH